MSVIITLLKYVLIVSFIVLALGSLNNVEKFADENNRLLSELASREQKVETRYILLTEDKNDDDEVMVVQEESVEPVIEVREVTETQGKTIGQSVELPSLSTSRKVCTDYRVYNIKGTPHNRMQMVAHTDVLGCRRYGEHYIVGLGSAYADRVGELFEVELDTGVTFTIITGDMKADVHTDETNRYAPIMNYKGELCANILEFIVDKEVLDIKAYQWGGVDYYNKFKGDIVRMTYLGRDTSADWDIYT